MSPISAVSGRPAKRPAARATSPYLIGFEELESRDLLAASVMPDLYFDLPSDGSVSADDVYILVYGQAYASGTDSRNSTSSTVPAGTQLYLTSSGGSYAVAPTSGVNNYSDYIISLSSLSQNANGSYFIDMPNKFLNSSGVVVFVGDGINEDTFSALSTPTIGTVPNTPFVVTEFTFNQSELNFDTSAVDGQGFTFQITTSAGSAAGFPQVLGNPSSLDREEFFTQAQAYFNGTAFEGLFAYDDSGALSQIINPSDYLSTILKAPSLNNPSVAAGQGTMDGTHTYYYLITAVGDQVIPNSHALTGSDVYGESLVSNIVMSPTASGGAVSLSWQSYPGTELASYNIYRSDSATGEFELIANVSKTTTSYLDTSDTHTSLGTIDSSSENNYGYSELSTFFTQALYDFFHQYTDDNSFQLVNTNMLFEGETVVRSLIHQFEASTGGTNAATITIDGGSNVADYYAGMTLVVSDGTSNQQHVTISSYDATTKVAVLDTPVTFTTGNTISIVEPALKGNATAGSSTSITLASDAEIGTGYYTGMTLWYESGGQWYSAEITAYDGTTKIATIDTGSNPAPTAATQYEIWSEYTILKLTTMGGQMPGGIALYDVFNVYEPLFNDNTKYLVFNGQAYNMADSPAWLSETVGNAVSASLLNPSAQLFGAAGVFGSSAAGDPFYTNGDQQAQIKNLTNPIDAAFIRGLATNFNIDPMNWGANKPSLSTVTGSNSGGTIPAGQYVYGISAVNYNSTTPGDTAETSISVMQPATITGNTGSVTLSWTASNGPVAIDGMLTNATNDFQFNSSLPTNLTPNAIVYIEGFAFKDGGTDYNFTAGYYLVKEVHVTSGASDPSWFTIVKPSEFSAIAANTTLDLNGATPNALSSIGVLSYNIYRAKVNTDGSYGDIELVGQISNSGSTPATSFTVTSDTSVGTGNPVIDYATGSTSSLYSKFMHQPQISLYSLVYSFAYDDQGGTSSDISFPEGTAPSYILYTINSWGTTTPSTPPSTGKFVTNLYTDILNRNPDSNGYNSWVNTVNSTNSRQSTASGIYTSTEHRTDQIQSYYQLYLGRDADAQGLQHWLTLFASGASQSDIIYGFVASVEFSQLHASNADFVTALYSDLLGRRVDTVGMNTWMQDLANGVSRDEIIWGFINSQEYLYGLVEIAYQQILNRDADSEGLNHWFDWLAEGNSPDSMRISMFGSNEYYQYN